MSSVDLFVSTGRDENLVRFLLRVFELESSYRVSLVTDSRAKLKSESVQLEGISTVCRHLALSNGVFPAAQLLGCDSQEAAQISEWINVFLAERLESGDSSYKRLNAHLESRVFLVGQQLTLADLMVYVTIHADAMAFPVAQYGHFCNMLRWHDFIQDTVDVTSVLPPVKRKLPVFDFVTSCKAVEKKKDNKVEETKTSSTEEKASKKKAVTSVATSNGDVPTTVQEKPESDEAKGKKSKGEKEKKEKKQKQQQAKKKDEPRIDMVDMRIGKILSVKQHPDADALYVEEINVGEEKPRQIISGLVKFVTIEEMQDRIVIVCCNLKPANMRGIQSCGMVMCASDSEHTKVEPLVVPEGVEIGEKITFEGFDAEPLDEIKPKQKILEALFPDLITDAHGIAKYKDAPFMTTKGPARSKIENGHVR